MATRELAAEQEDDGSRRTRALRPREGAEGVCRVRIGGQERLDAELGRGEVDGGAELVAVLRSLRTSSPARTRRGTAMPSGGVRSVPPGGYAESSPCNARSCGSPVSCASAGRGGAAGAAPLRQIEDPRRQPLRVQAQPQHVDRRLEQLPAHAVGQQRRRARFAATRSQRPVDHERPGRARGRPAPARSRRGRRASSGSSSPRSA